MIATEFEERLARVPRQIITPRLVITPPDLKNLADLSRSMLASWDEMHRWVKWANRKQSLSIEEYGQQIETQIRTFHAGTSYFGVSRLRESGTSWRQGALGPQVTLYQMDLDKGEGQCGYWTPTPLAGHGLTTEGMAAMLHVGFEYYGLKKIWANVGKNNGASHGVLTKLGFRFDRIEPGASETGSGAKLNGYYYVLDDPGRLPKYDLVFDRNGPSNDVRAAGRIQNMDKPSP